MIFKFLSWIFGHVEKQLDQKDKVNFKIYNATTWVTENCNTYVNQYLKKERQSGNDIWLVKKNHTQYTMEMLFPDHFLKNQN